MRRCCSTVCLAMIVLDSVLWAQDKQFLEDWARGANSPAAPQHLRAQSAPAVAQGQRGADDGDRHGNRIVPGLGVLRRGSSFGIRGHPVYLHRRYYGGFGQGWKGIWRSASAEIGRASCRER